MFDASPTAGESLRDTAEITGAHRSNSMDKTVTSLLSPFQQVFDHFWNIPVTNWQRFFNPQMVFNYNPQDENVEYHVLQRVGSYGHQLSTLISMLQLLRQLLPDESRLSAAQRETLSRFERLRIDSQRAVEEFRGAPSPEQVVNFLQTLKQQNPQAYAALQEQVGTEGEATTPAARASRPARKSPAAPKARKAATGRRH